MRKYRIPVYRGFNRGLTVNKSTKGEPIEHKIERIVSNKEPIKDGAPIIYTERKTGVNPSHNIRTDRFEIAIDAMEKVAKSYKAKREERAKMAEDGKAKSIQGKEETSTEQKQGGQTA